MDKGVSELRQGVGGVVLRVVLVKAVREGGGW